jgi:hypothetical protein
VAKERGEHCRSDSGKLHNAGDGDSRQRLDVRGGGNEHGGDSDEQCGDTDSEPGAGSADDHDGTSEPDSDSRADGDIYGGSGRDGTARLPVAEERSEHHGSKLSELHDTSNGDLRQRLDVRGGGNEHGGDSDEHGSNVDGEPGTGGADDHDTAGEPDSDGGTDGDVYGGGSGDGTARLPVAEERGEHRRGKFSELHDGGDDDSG